MAAGVYSWKSTNELQQKNSMANAMQGQSPSPFGTAPAPRQPSPAGTGGAASLPTPGPSAGVSAFAMPKTMGEAMRAPMPTQESNMTLAQKNIQQGFQPLPSYGPADDLARNELQKTLDANKRATLEQSALSRRGQTGQIGGDLVNYLGTSAVPAKADLEANLQANRMTQDTQRAQNAQTNLLGLGGLAQQKELSLAGIASQEKMQGAQIASNEKLGAADLSIREKTLAQNASQFKDELSFKKYATDAGFTDAEAQRVWQSGESSKQIASAEKLGLADLSLKERALVQSASQFNDELSFKKYATDAGFTDAEAQRSWQASQNEKQIASQEKLGLADLSIREQTLAQNASQFKDELSFKKYATDAGFTDSEAQRTWQSVENSKQIASTEKVSFAGLSQQEKELAQQASQFTDKLAWDKEATKLGLDDKTAERVWQGSENQKERDARATDSNLNRELQKYLGDKGLDMDEQKLAENIRQFDSKEAFDKWATQAGLDAQSNELIWKSNEADISRKWETGERLSTQEHQVNLTNLQNQLDVGKINLQQTLKIDTMDKQAAIDKTMAEAANDYQVARDTKAMSHDMAMEEFRTNNTAKLEALGYDHQTAMQATEIQAQAIEKAKDRNLETLQAKAELAYKYKSLADQTGLSQQEIDLKTKTAADQISIGLQQLGLDTKKVEAAIASQDFQERAGVLSTMMEMGADNPDVADRVAKGYLDLMKEKGLLTDQQYADAVTGLNTPDPVAPPSTPGSWSTDNSARDLINGLGNISKGNLLTGVPEVYSGVLGAPVSVAKDATHAVLTGARAVSNFFGW